MILLEDLMGIVLTHLIALPKTKFSLRDMPSKFN